MNIQDALKETGKVHDGGDEYISEERLILYWYDKETNTKNHPVGYRAIVKEDRWKPYHEVKEIKPEKAGELWETENGNYFMTYEREGAFYYRNKYGVEGLIGKGLNLAGWTRIFSPVEDNKVCAFDHACLDKDIDILKLAEEVGPLPENIERMLAEDEVDVICDMLKEEVQFYGPGGVKNNAGVIYQIAEVLCKATKETS